MDCICKAETNDLVSGLSEMELAELIFRLILIRREEASASVLTQ